ncbi:MAG: NAD(P)-dependent oxidoreductase, partial [Myxococcales bacterium]|nr:NAD(P)-dependent oxidoreductase [Myxococcales bacterium]
MALLGTGLIGAGLSENMLARGLDLTVWNRTASKTQPLVDLGAK